MKKLGIGAVILFVTQFTYAQTKKDVGTFTAVEATDKIQVELIKSNSYEVISEGANSENIQIINNNGSLRIKMNTLNVLQGNNVSVKVYYQALQDISAKKGAKIVTRSDQIIVSDHLTVSAAEGGLVDIYVDAKKLDVKPASGSTIAITGTSITQDVISNFGGKYEGKGLITDVTNVTVNGGGIADVHAKNSVVAKTRAGGVINVYGSPAQKSEKKVIGGVINYK